MMPEGSGFHAIRNIKKINDKAKIIAVTADLKESTNKKLMVLKDTLQMNLTYLAQARVTCIKDEWSCKSVLSKTMERIYQLDEDPTQEIKLEDRIEFCFNNIVHR